jgi:hypothetical protein
MTKFEQTEPDPEKESLKNFFDTILPPKKYMKMVYYFIILFHVIQP